MFQPLTIGSKEFHATLKQVLYAVCPAISASRRWLGIGGSRGRTSADASVIALGNLYRCRLLAGVWRVHRCFEQFYKARRRSLETALTCKLVKCIFLTSTQALSRRPQVSRPTGVKYSSLLDFTLGEYRRLFPASPSPDVFFPLFTTQCLNRISSLFSRRLRNYPKCHAGRC
jgi:hypothetical protein